MSAPSAPSGGAVGGSATGFFAAPGGGGLPGQGGGVTVLNNIQVNGRSIQALITDINIRQQVLDSYLGTRNVGN